MKQPELTRGILGRYRELSERRGLQHWRKVVPRDVRRLWIRHLLSDIAREKIVNTPAFEGLVLQYATPRDRSYIEHTKTQLSQIPRTQSGAVENDTMDECLSEYEAALAQVDLPDEALEQFAELYFLSFRGTERRGEKIGIRFGNEVQRSAETVYRLMSDIVSHPSAVSTVVRELHDEKTFRGRELVTKAQHGSLLQFRQPPFTAVVVYGSAAIGPRTNTYPGTQDIDIMLIPYLPARSRGRQFFHQRIEWTNVVFGYIHQLSEQWASLSEEDQAAQERVLTTHLSSLRDLLQQLRTDSPSLDIHLPDHPTQPDATVEDWPKLCGPHLVLRHDSQVKSYDLYLQRAIRSARASVQ